MAKFENKGSSLPEIPDLRKFAKALTSLSVPLMEGRTKGEMETLIASGAPVTIRDYDFLSMDSKDGKKVFVVIVVDEYPEAFFFGGQVLTDQLQQFDAAGYHDSIVESGIPMLLSTKKSENGFKYTKVVWYPEA